MFVFHIDMKLDPYAVFIGGPPQVSQQTGERPTEAVAIALGGLTKMYVGELIETSRLVLVFLVYLVCV